MKLSQPYILKVIGLILRGHRHRVGSHLDLLIGLGSAWVMQHGPRLCVLQGRQIVFHFLLFVIPPGMSLRHSLEYGLLCLALHQIRNWHGEV